MKFFYKTIFMLLPVFCWSQQVEVNGAYSEEVRGKAFELTSDSQVTISGNAGIFGKGWETLLFYAWIIDTETREVVWHWLDEEGTIRRGDGGDDQDLFGLRAIDKKLQLEEGKYELYFGGGSAQNIAWKDRANDIDSFGDLMHVIFRSRRRTEYNQRYQRELGVVVSAPSLRPISLSDAISEKLESSIVAFTRTEENEKLEFGFTLTTKTNLDIYAVGEGERNEAFDYFWIYNAASQERVFEMSYKNSDYAGGASKNISTKRSINLEAGSYKVSYVTDDSHDYGGWNAIPPDDPEFWGVTIWPSSSTDATHVVEYKQPKTGTPLVDLSRVRNNELLSQGLRVNKEAEVLIVCYGEEGNRRDMVDYGWIINADTREIVWEMDSWDTEHAGGAEKNRWVKEKISLEPGNYVVYYSSDGSHAYRSWNSAKPREEEKWGIQVYPVNDSAIEKIEVVSPEDLKSESLIADISLVGNNEVIREQFEIEEDTEVVILGLGEGEYNEMYDYGYIQDIETGDVVYEMRYGDSKHAGGAKKNREFRERIVLEKGAYRLVYKSDDSHSFKKWNADPPRNSEDWGIRILKY